MVRKKQDLFNKKDVISASEIGQFVYCSMSWYLLRCGYKPDSLLLDLGKKTHVNLGCEIDKIKSKSNLSKRYAYLSYLFLIIAFILVFFEVFV